MGCIAQLHFMHQQSLKLAAPTAVLVLPTQTNARFFVSRKSLKIQQSFASRFNLPQYECPLPPPQKKMAKRCKKDQRNPLSWWIFGKLNTRCTKLLCMPQHLEPPLTKSSTQRGPRHSANEQPVKIQWVLKTHGVLFVEIQENPMKIIVFFIYIYILFAFWFIFGKRRLLYIQHTVHRVLRDKGGNSYHR